MVEKQLPPSLQISKSDRLLPETQEVCAALFKEIAKAMAFKNLDHKQKCEYPLSCIISLEEFSENLIFCVPALHSHKYCSFPFHSYYATLHKKKQNQILLILKRRRWLDNTSSPYLKPHCLLLAETLWKMVNPSFLYNVRESSLKEKYLLEKVCNTINGYVIFRHQGMIYRGASGKSNNTSDAILLQD